MHRIRLELVFWVHQPNGINYIDYYYTWSLILGVVESEMDLGGWISAAAMEDDPCVSSDIHLRAI